MRKVFNLYLNFFKVLKWGRYLPSASERLPVRRPGMAAASNAKQFDNTEGYTRVSACGQLLMAYKKANKHLRNNCNKNNNRNMQKINTGERTENSSLRQLNKNCLCCCRGRDSTESDIKLKLDRQKYSMYRKVYYQRKNQCNDLAYIFLKSVAALQYFLLKVSLSILYFLSIIMHTFDTLK